MALNTALSGLSAASADLRITGNNIANASTTGFKASRAEFADAYASSLLGSGSSRIGSGVRLANVAQHFNQGTISFTNNNLDIAIDGNGFFVMNKDGVTSYTRSGAFGLDNEGFVVNNTNARVQGFTANETGTLNGIVGDLQINPNNLDPKQTTFVETVVNLDARSDVLAQFGSRIDTAGNAIGVAQIGQAISTPTTLVSSASQPLTPFDFSIDQASSLSAPNTPAPFDFSINRASAVSAISSSIGSDFGVNSASSVTGSGNPAFFNFSDKASAVSGTSASVFHDYSGGNGATFDVTIAGSPSDGTQTVTLNTNIASVTDLATAINAQLGGIGVLAEADPANSSRIRFVATDPGLSSTVSLNNFTANGTTTVNDLQASLSGIADGTSSVRSAFDVSVTGGSSDGSATVELTGNLSSMASLLSEINGQLLSAGIGVRAQESLANPGRLQFVSTDAGIPTTVQVDNLRTSDVGVTVSNLENMLRIRAGDSSASSSAGVLSHLGSFTEASFDVSIAGGSGAGGNASATLILDQDYTNSPLDDLIDDLNNQLQSVSAPGIDLRAEEDPNNPGRIRFAATVSGEPSTVTVSNFAVSGVAGSEQTTVADVSALLGGIADGATDVSGQDNTATFQLSLTNASLPSANQVVTIRLDSNIATLQDLIQEIRDDLAGTGIGIDVRDDPENPGRLQFYALESGEASVITVDPNDNATFGTGATRLIVEGVLGGIPLGQAGGPGASNENPDPYASSSATGQSGSISSATFDVTLSGAGTLNGTATVTLDDDVQTLDDLIDDVRIDLLQSGIGVDVREDPENPGVLQFFSVVSGEASTIAIRNIDASNFGVTTDDVTNVLNLATGVSTPGVASVSNGYDTQSIDVVAPDGSIVTLETEPGASAAEIAAAFSNSAIRGVVGNARTSASISADGFENASGTLVLAVNGVQVQGENLQQLADAIENAIGLGTVSGSIDETGNLVIEDQVGNDLFFNVVSGDPADRVEITGVAGDPISLVPGDESAVAVGGTVELTMDEGVRLTNPQPPVSNLFGVLVPGSFETFELNTFDPDDQETYNNATSQTIYDSLGNPHNANMYFVKERFDPFDPTTRENLWSVYVLVNGQDVGDPDPNLPPPQNEEPTRARYAVQFNPDGTLNPAGSDQILISNWQPLDSEGVPNGALGPQNVLAGGALPIPNPPSSSNFELVLGDTTQFGSGFAVHALSQNGYTTGELAGIAIDDDGVLSARFTNGQDQVLGQFAVADFKNPQGLAPVGETAWIESASSGEPAVGVPGSGRLGNVSSGALEDSNVDLSEELVRLIVAQRNFQANARTISTTDEITQTIINL